MQYLGFCTNAQKQLICIIVLMLIANRWGGHQMFLMLSVHGAMLIPFVMTTGD